MPIAPSTYYDHTAPKRDPERLSKRAKRGAALMPEIRRVFDENSQVYLITQPRRCPPQVFDIVLLRFGGGR